MALHARNSYFFTKFNEPTRVQEKKSNGHYNGQTLFGRKIFGLHNSSTQIITDQIISDKVQKISHGMIFFIFGLKLVINNRKIIARII
jgi:hypothetical protein